MGMSDRNQDNFKPVPTRSERVRDPRTTLKEVEKMMNNLLFTKAPGLATAGTLPVYAFTGNLIRTAGLRAAHLSHLLVVGSR
jgi:hypothetical protein